MEVKNISLEKPKNIPMLVEHKVSREIYLVTRGVKSSLVFTALVNNHTDIQSLIVSDVDFDNLDDYLEGFIALPKGHIVQLIN
jgi:hypothetical protein